MLSWCLSFGGVKKVERRVRAVDLCDVELEHCSQASAVFILANACRHKIGCDAT